MTAASPRMITGIVCAIAMPTSWFAMGNAERDRFSQPDFSRYGIAEPFSSTFCASKCERP